MQPRSLRTATAATTVTVATAAAIALSALPLHAAEVVLVEEDFESEFAPESVSPNPNVFLDVVDDPAAGGGRGKVGVIDISGGGEWGALDAFPDQKLSLVENGIQAGVDTYMWEAWFYIPSGTSLGSEDSINMISRFVPDQAESSKTEQSNSNSVSGLDRDGWFRISQETTVPASASTGSITLVRPILSIRDQAPDGLVGPAVYVDDIKFTAVTSGEDPGISAPGASPFGAFRGTLEQFATIEIGNFGATQTLSVSDLELTGPDAASYSFDPPAPIDVLPGSTALVDITFTPTEERSYEADLVITSNATTNSTLPVPLNALVLPENPTAEDDLIINGGFETGDTVGFGGTDIAVTSDVAHTGMFSGVYTFPGGSQWGSLPLNQPSPPATVTRSEWIEITEDMIDQLWSFSAWLTVPEENQIGFEDVFSIIIRWNGHQPDDLRAASVTGADLFPGEWWEVFAEGFVPFDKEDTPGSGNFVPITSAHVILSFEDREPLATGVEQVFIDDISFKIERSGVEPPESDLSIVSVDFARDEITGAGTVTLVFTSSAGSTFTIDRGQDLANWTPLVTDFPAGPGDTTTYVDGSVGEAGEYYYRVTLNPAP